MNEKKDKKSKKPEHVSKNWKSSQGIRLLAMVLAIVSGFLVGVTSVETVTLGMNSDWQGSQKDIEKILDTELLRSYAYWMGDAVTGISKEQDEADALKKFDDGNIVYSLVKNKPNEKETELVCGNYTGTSLNKENALAWLKFTDENEFHTNDRSFWDMLLGRNRGQYMQKVKHYTQVDHFIYDNGVIYCYAGDTLFRINSFSFYAVPEESDLEPYVEYTYRESDDGGRYCAENGEQLKKGKLEPYLKSSELRFDFDGLEAGYLWSKKDGIYPIRQESIADTYAKAKVFQWQDFSFAYEDQQGRIYYNPHQEKEATEYTLYLTVADSLKGSTATVSSLFSPEVGGETHIVIDSGKTQFFQKAHTLAGVVVQVREISGLWLLLSVLVWVFSLGILFASAGWKRGSDTVQIRWIDRIPFGIYTGISGLAFLGCGMVCLYMGDLLMQNAGIVFCISFFTIAFALAELIVYEYVISIIVRIRAGKFWHYTLLRLLLNPFRRIKRELHEIRLALLANLSMTVKGTAVFLVVFLIEAFLLLCAGADGGIIMVYLLWKVVEYGVLLKIVVQFRQIFDGGERIAKGDYSHPIHTEKMMYELRTHAENLNNVQTGVAAAVEEKMKSERFRTELITNVSHDIKTPLTSIINYVDLLKRLKITEEPARSYIEVLDSKSQRLKQLTDDLVEASKISSGNIVLNLEQLNLTELLNQAVGEFSDRMEEKKLQVIFDGNDVAGMIYADSRRMWRIIENLFQNICKYALEGTRVYLEMQVKDGRVIASVKNISDRPMNLKGEELSERFIRGDASRTTEGSGLGLYIAKNLTKAQHGEFQIQLDGDLFKIILDFPEYHKPEEPATEQLKETVSKEV